MMIFTRTTAVPQGKFFDLVNWALTLVTLLILSFTSKPMVLQWGASTFNHNRNLYAGQ